MQIYIGWEKTTMFRPHSLKAFSEKLNWLNVDDDEITTMENFSGTTTYITPINHNILRCPVYFFDAVFQGNISGLPKWETQSGTGIYIGHSPFHAVSVDLVLNPATSHVSP